MASRHPLVVGTSGIQNLAAADSLTASQLFNAGADTTLTIAAGVISVVSSKHQVETEGAAASDDLDTINGGGDGDILVIRAEDSAHTVVVKHGTGNIYLAGSNDQSLTHVRDTLTLLCVSGTEWHQMFFSNNGA